MSSDVTRNSGAPANIYPSRVPESPPPFHSFYQHLTWRPTWPVYQPARLEVLGSQATQSALPATFLFARYFQFLQRCSAIGILWLLRYEFYYYY